MPWMTATTATRNARETMMPSSVKNERSLWLQIVSTARITASKSGTAKKLLVPQGFNRIQPRRPARGIEPESDAGERGREERRHNRPQPHVGRDGRDLGDQEHESAAPPAPRRPDHAREARGSGRDLPEDGAARRSQRLADADLPRSLGHRDHHDGDYPDAAHHQA